MDDRIILALIVVIGLMLQNSVGQIVSGLFMLFEQPFRIGDWLDTPVARGRIVEANWRAVHIQTGHGLQMQNPQYEILDAEDGETIHTGRIVPVYEKTGSVTAKIQRKLVYDALQRLPDDVADHLPEAVFADHVVHGVVDQDRIEAAAEIEVDHVAILGSPQRQRDHVGSEQRLEPGVGIVTLGRDLDVDFVALAGVVADECKAGIAAAEFA